MRLPKRAPLRPALPRVLRLRVPRRQAVLARRFLRPVNTKGACRLGRGCYIPNFSLARSGIATRIKRRRTKPRKRRPDLRPIRAPAWQCRRASSPPRRMAACTAQRCSGSEISSFSARTQSLPTPDLYTLINRPRISRLIWICGIRDRQTCSRAH